MSCIANEYTGVLESSVNTCECQPGRLESDFRLLFFVEAEEMCFPAQIMDPSRNDYQVLGEMLSKLSLHPCADRWSVRLISYRASRNIIGARLSLFPLQRMEELTLCLVFLNEESSSQQ